MQLLLRQAVSFPEDAVRVSLDALVDFSEFDPFQRPAAVVPIKLDPGISTTEFPCHHGSSSTPKKRIKDNVLRARACKYEFCDQFFSLENGSNIPGGLSYQEYIDRIVNRGFDWFLDDAGIRKKLEENK